MVGKHDVMWCADNCRQGVVGEIKAGLSSPEVYAIVNSSSCISKDAFEGKIVGLGGKSTALGTLDHRLREIGAASYHGSYQFAHCISKTKFHVFLESFLSLGVFVSNSRVEAFIEERIIGTKWGWVLS
jgi:hypothetical protein